MIYEKQINETFTSLKITPRAGQVEAIDSILTFFIDGKFKNVILCAPTGTGKSIIGLVVAETLSKIKNPHQRIKSSIILSATNMLLRQYDNSFSPIINMDFMMIKGANNYDCTALGIDETTQKTTTADNCAFYTMVSNQSEFGSIIKNHCDKCEYLKMKKRKNTVQHVTTNYSYYFIDRMYTQGFEDRDVVVWDEAHLVNDLFSEHNAITFSQKAIQKMAEEIGETVRITDVEITKILKSIAQDCGIKDKINEANYVTYLNALVKVYTYAKERGAEEAEKALRAGNMKSYTKLNRFTKSYEGRLCKIDDMFTYDYDRVFEYKEFDKAVSIKPVFVGKMIETLQAAKHNLFMSATVSDEFMIKTLNLGENETVYLKLDPSFAKENKEVVFMDPQSLSYTSLQNPEVVKKLRKNTAKIVSKHISEGDRGIILTPSFKLQQEIVDELTPLVRKGEFKLFEHRQGEKLENIVAAFKSYSGSKAILISPSMFEGVDLPGDLSRFQILIKAPFPSLGDKRMKYILDRHPSLYNSITIMKMVQGAGRSVRSDTDYAVTYILDSNAQRLFNSKQNLWKNEFNIRFTQFI